MELFTPVQKRALLLFTTLTLAFGSVPALAETLEESFDDVTVESDYKTMSNGWFVLGSENIYSSATYYYYGIGSDSDYRAYSGKSLYSMYGSSIKDSYIVIPKKLTGTVSFQYRAACNSRAKYTPVINLLAVTENDGEYVVGDVIQTLNPTKGGGWNEASIELEGATMVAIQLFRAYIDDFSATVFEDGEEPGPGQDDDPKTDPEPALTVSTDAIAFGTTNEAKTESFTVSSNIDADIALSIAGEGAAAFLLVDAPTSLTANEQVAVNVKFDAAEAGDYAAMLTITAGELTKEVALSGSWETKSDNPQTDPSEWRGEDFTGLTEIPAEWTNDGWEIDDWRLDSAPSAAGSGTLITPLFAIAEGEALQFYFQKSFSYSWGSSFAVDYSTDKTNWANVPELSFTGTGSDFEDGTKTIEFPAAGNYYVRFTANTKTYLDNFAIVAVAPIPANMEVMAFETTTAEVTADEDGSYEAAFEVTVGKTGNQSFAEDAMLTVSLLDADQNVLTTSETISFSGKTASVNLSYQGTASETGSVDFYVKNNFTDEVFAAKASVMVTVKQTEEPEPKPEPDPDSTEWRGEDFTGLTEIPAEWTNDGWEIDDWRLDSAPSAAGSGTLITPLFTIAEGEVLQFFFQKSFSYSWGSSFAVDYSTDKTNWVNVPELSFTGTGSDFEDGTKTIEFPAVGDYYVRFTANTKTYLDDFAIVAVAPIPANMEVMAFETTTAEVTADEDGNYEAAFEVTVAKTGNQNFAEDAMLTVSLLDADQNVLSTSETISFSGNTATVNLSYQGTASETATVDFYVKNNFTDEVFAAKASVMVTVNQTEKPEPIEWDGTEDFEENTKPAGWIADDNWTFEDGMAKGTYSISGRKYLTTPEVKIAEGKTMRFEARKSNGESYWSPDIIIAWSKDGGEFVNCKTIVADDLTTEFKAFVFEDMEPGTYKFRFQDDNYDLDNFKVVPHVATGIKSASNAATADKAYDLMGRSADKHAKIMIVKGKKIMTK